MASRQRAKKRRDTSPVKKKRSWGFIAAGAAVTFFGVAVIGYAATREPFDPEHPDIAGLTEKHFEGSGHQDGPIAYEESPPFGGPHNATPQTCAVYAAPIPNENALHSLEHGAVWITYRPDLPDSELDALRELVEGRPSRMLSPFDGLQSPIVASAWGQQLKLDSADDQRLDRFLRAFTNGAQAPEQGAACQGNTSTGSLGPAPPPLASPSPSS